ncbi:hypothetical protein AALC16_19620 [Lachnospiraceae bacterium 29-91]
MEKRYWEQFSKTGGVCDYLEYKMELYGHGENKNQAGGEGQIRQEQDSVIIPLYREEDDTA